MADLLVRPDVPPRWPSAVRIELERRHASIAAHLHTVDAVLDVSAPPGRAVLTDALAGRLPDERFDAVVSVAGLVRFADLGAAVAGIVDLLAPGGELHAVEPVGRPDLTGLVAGSLGALVPAARGSHLGRDLVAVARDRGLTVTDLLRLTMPTTVWPLRPFVALRGLRIDGRPWVEDR